MIKQGPEHTSRVAGTSPPVLVLSVCWRTGSTLLQRLLCDAGILVWGESGGALDGLEDAFERYRQMTGPGGTRFRHGFGGNGTQQYERFASDPRSGAHHWIACMNPPPPTIEDAFRNLFLKLYAHPAHALGFGRWGIKEVQVGADAARWMQTLFPGSQVVVLARHPYDVLLSIKRRNWMDRRETRFPLLHYARHWARMARSLRTVPDAVLVRYEDLVGRPETCERLAERLQAPVRFELIETSRADWRAERNASLTRAERLAIRALTREAASDWGYRL